MDGTPVSLSRVVSCASPPGVLWPLLADTERFNRAVGLSRIGVSPLSGPRAARFLVRTTLNGFPVEYEENPAEFVAGERFEFVRTMRRGPVRALEMGFQLDAEGQGTRVTVTLQLWPRFRLFAPIARMSGARTLSTFAKEVEQIDREARSGKPVEVARKATPPDHTAFGRASAALRKLAPGAAAPLADKLIEHVRSGPDVALSRIRPFELADAWGAPRRDVLALCLQAVTAGLLELSWDLVCPSCRTSAERTATLSDLGEAGHCQLCDLSFGLALDKAVEATFRPPRALRAVDEGPYCISGPARTPHVLAQAVVPARGAAVLRVPGEHGRMRLFVRGGATASLEARADGPPLAQVRLAGGHVEPAVVAVQPGGRLQVQNDAGAETHAKIERSEWVNRAATAAAVSTLPEFRRLFSGEVLKPGLALKVGRVALLFSDLTGSTALYTKAGDAAAFRLVRDSFDVLRPAVEGNGGALVKTIGDAVMAVFLTEEQAIRAAVAMLRAFPPFVEGYPYASGVDLKLGVHAGPCFAVTANGVLDYFGQTVNVAARLQGQARAGELVLEEELAGAAQAAGWLDGARVAERYAASLKGVEGKLDVVRIRSDRDATGTAAAAAPAASPSDPRGPRAPPEGQSTKRV